MHLGVFTELSCHEKAQRGLHRLQQDPDSALKRQSNSRLDKPQSPASGTPTETSPKRRRREEASTERLPKRCRRQDLEEGGLVPINPRHDNLQRDKEQQGKEEDAQAIVTKAMDGLKKLRVENKDNGLFTELPVQLADGRIEVKAHQSRHRTQDSNTMWQFANDHASKGKDTVWLFRLLSVCLSIIETSLHKKPAPLGNKEDLKKSGWVKGMSILNRIIDQVGFIGLRLYDAYASKSTYLYTRSACAKRQIKEFIFISPHTPKKQRPIARASLIYQQRLFSNKGCQPLPTRAFFTFRTLSGSFLHPTTRNAYRKITFSCYCASLTLLFKAGTCLQAAGPGVFRQIPN